MWIMLNDAFISIVASPPEFPNQVAVRARAKGDLERVFGKDIDVKAIPGRDYAYRTFLPKARVAEVVAARVLGINYGNFKSSVKENDRHDAYFRVWEAMAAFQAKRGHGAPYRTHGAGGKDTFARFSHYDDLDPPLKGRGKGKRKGRGFLDDDTATFGGPYGEQLDIDWSEPVRARRADEPTVTGELTMDDIWGNMTAKEIEEAERNGDFIPARYRHRDGR